MKKLQYLIAAILLATLALNLSSCKKDDPEPDGNPTEQDEATATLRDGSPWTVSEINDAPDALEAGDYEGLNNLQVTFEATGEGASIEPGAFTASGADLFLSSEDGASWSWSGDGTSTIALQSASTNQLTGFTINSDGTIQFTFVAPNTEAARVSDVGGSYTVTLE